MSIFLQQFVNLVQLGSIYALLAIGFSIVYGIARLVNFAHGPIFMVSTYLLFYFGTAFYNFVDNSWAVYLLAVLFSALITSGLAVLIEKFAYKPLRGGPIVSLVVSSVGVGMILEYGVLLTIGPVPKRMPALILDLPIVIGDVKFSLASVIIIVMSAVSMVILSLFIRKSRTGVALRAVSQDPVAASFMGISRNMIISVAFALGAIMATIGASSTRPSTSPSPLHRREDQLVQLHRRGHRRHWQHQGGGSGRFCSRRAECHRSDGDAGFFLQGYPGFHRAHHHPSRQAHGPPWQEDRREDMSGINV
jgi:branched-chain amino acid transport system permease protein